MALDHPFFSGLRPTVPIAHRGGAKLAPENTLEAFRQAVDVHRMAMLEIDVQVSADGVLCVTHDPTLERCTDGEGAIAVSTWSRLRKLDAGYNFSLDGGKTFPYRGQGVRIPRLEEVYEAFPGLHINVELKPESAESVDLFAAAVGPEIARTCCGSESDEVAAAIHEALPDACLFYPRHRLAETVLAWKSGDQPPPDDRFTVLDMPLEYGGVPMIDKELLGNASSFGKWVNVWTVDEFQDMRQLLDLGVGGIMTDRPDRLRALLG